ncbi:MAG: SH3 domain-containing protein [Clostridia bacterium]|nr:SH3 domain-containing protein [Clostridia bacterium]
MKRTVRLMILTALILAFAALGVAQAEIIPAHGLGQIGYEAVALCETLSVRDRPSTSGNVVMTVPYGSLLLLPDGEKDGWAEVLLSDSIDATRVGYVNTDYIAIDPAWYRTEGRTRVYAWGDTSAPKVALLEKDTTVPILKEEGDWLVVSLRGASGWIHK